MLDPVYIDATDIPDAWYQCLYAIFRHGKEYTVQKGSFAEEKEKRLEFDFVAVHIRNPGLRPLIPIIDVPGIPPPTSLEYVETEYLPYLLTANVAKDETYTYGERINNPKLRVIKDGKAGEAISMGCNPLEMVIEQYKRGDFGQNQLTMEIGMPSDLLIPDPPCLRIIDTKARFDENIGKYRLHFCIYFRSWDLWGGVPSNLAGLQLMKEYMLDCIGRDDLVDGDIIACSKGLHLYGYSLEVAGNLTHNLHKHV